MHNSFSWQKTGKTIIIISIALVVLALLYFSLHKNLLSDESESIAAASLISQGQVPYRDFWQIHTPLTYYFLVPLCLCFHTMKVLFAGRLIAVGLLLFNGWLIYRIIAIFLPTTAAWLGLLCYLSALPIFNVELRPDDLVVLFANLSLFLLLWPRQPAGILFFLSGVSAALGLLSKQSGAFCIFSIIIFFVCRSLTPDEKWDKSIFGKDRYNVTHYCFWGCGLLLPCVLFCLYLTIHGAWQSFLQCAVDNDFLNTFLFQRIKSTHWGPNSYILQMLGPNILIFIAALTSIVCLLICKQNIPLKIKNVGVIVCIFFAVAAVALYRVLHAWWYELMVPSQYLILLATPIIFIVGERVGIFFERKNKAIAGVVVNGLLLAAISLPTIIFLYTQSKGSLKGDIKVYDEILELTNKDDKLFSVIPIPFRPSVYYHHIGRVLVEANDTYKMVQDKLVDEILHERVIVIMPNHRYDGMRRLARLIQNSYLMDGQFYVPGVKLSPDIAPAGRFYMVATGYYQLKEIDTTVFIDGLAMNPGRIYLKQGRHHFYFQGAQMCLKKRRICVILYDFVSNKEGVR